MGFYTNHILPHLIHWSMRQDTFTPFRRRVLAGADGRVLEIGIGSGINLALYPPAVTHVVGIDASSKLLALARERSASAAVPVELIGASAEHIPMPHHSVDTVVTTWTLCSIRDVHAALREMCRVLKPGGQLLFVEHGLSPDAHVQRWQHRLTPLWKPLAGGCHLNRAIAELIEGAGFHLERVDNTYMAGPRPLTYMYEGRARPTHGPR
jgi:ubiquinone/menaquinone biosynthesis C-methylase UbiE